MYEKRKKELKNDILKRILGSILGLTIPGLLLFVYAISEESDHLILIGFSLMFASPFIFLIAEPIYKLYKLKKEPYEIITLEGEVEKTDYESSVCIKCFGHNPFTNTEMEFKIYENIENINIVNTRIMVDIYINIQTGEYHVDDDVVIAKLENRYIDKI